MGVGIGVNFLFTGTQNAYLVKRNTAGGVRLSRDPLNLLNVHSRKVCCILEIIWYNSG
jgi:hypothetical protein